MRNICILNVQLITTDSRDERNGKFVRMASVPGRAESFCYGGVAYTVQDVQHAVEDPTYGMDHPRHDITLFLERK